jgi:hypothetical protein
MGLRDQLDPPIRGQGATAPEPTPSNVASIESAPKAPTKRRQRRASAEPSDTPTDRAAQTIAGAPREQLNTRVPKPLLDEAVRELHLLRAEGVDANKQDLVAALLYKHLRPEPDRKALARIVRDYLADVE